MRILVLAFLLLSFIKSPILFAGAQKPFAMSAKQLVILKYMLRDEFRVMASGGDIMLEAPKGTVFVSANDLQETYEKNEVAGDLKFRGKPIVLHGVIASIDRSVGENYFVSMLGGSNQFIKPKAKMAYGNIQFLAELTKGEEISLSCRGNGMLLGSAMVEKCEPIAKWIETNVIRYVASIPKLVSEKQENFGFFGFITDLMGRRIPKDSSCEKDFSGKTCHEEGTKAIQGKRPTKEEVIEIAGIYGLDVEKVKGMFSTEASKEQ